MGLVHKLFTYKWSCLCPPNTV